MKFTSPRFVVPEARWTLDDGTKIFPHPLNFSSATGRATGM